MADLSPPHPPHTHTDNYTDTNRLRERVCVREREGRRLCRRKLGMRNSLLCPHMALVLAVGHLHLQHTLYMPMHMAARCPASKTGFEGKL